MKTHLILIIGLVLLTGFLSAQEKKASVSLTAAIYEEEVTGNLDKAVSLYLDILKKYPADRQVAAKTLYRLGLVNEKMGQKKANEYFRRLVNTYPDQTEMVALAKAKLTALGGSGDIGKTEVAMRLIWDANNNQPIGISPDGKYAIFMSSEDYNIWLRDLQSGEQKRVTLDASRLNWKFPTGMVAISPNGKLIAYGWIDGSSNELRLSALDGSSMKILKTSIDKRYIYSVAWMPDNKHILAVTYDNNDKNYRRHIISLSDGVIRDIGQPDQVYKSWSCPTPDGRHVIYIQEGDICIWNTSTEKDSVLIHNPAYNSALGWTPDGSRMIFTSNRSGTRDLYAVRIKNGGLDGEPELLRSDIGTKTLFLTSDGRLFRFENTGTTRSYIANVDPKTGKLAGTSTLVDANYPDAESAAWSADGKELYYLIWKGASDNQKQVLMIKSEVTGETREVPENQALSYYSNPVLSPDGSKFMVIGASKSDGYGLFAVDSKSGDVSQLAKIPITNSPVDPAQNWSPDGSMIYYKLRSLENNNLFFIRRKEIASGDEKDFIREIGFHTMKMKISSNGNQMLYCRTDKPNKSLLIGILDLQTNNEAVIVKIPDGPYSSPILFPSWSTDGKNVLVSIIVKESSELWRYPITGGDGEKLNTFNGTCLVFVLHPDGKRMLYSQTLTNYELWVLENLLPK